LGQKVAANSCSIEIAVYQPLLNFHAISISYLLVKPFAFAELLAKIRAVLRRGQTSDQMQKLVIEDLVLDRVTRQARRNDKIIELIAKEFQLLEYMMRNAGQILTKTIIPK
jgi:two-component system OmpR family response regulator